MNNKSQYSYRADLLFTELASGCKLFSVPALAIAAYGRRTKEAVHLQKDPFQFVKSQYILWDCPQEFEIAEQKTEQALVVR